MYESDGKWAIDSFCFIYIGFASPSISIVLYEANSRKPFFKKTKKKTSNCAAQRDSWCTYVNVPFFILGKKSCHCEPTKWTYSKNMNFSIYPTENFLLLHSNAPSSLKPIWKIIIIGQWILLLPSTYQRQIGIFLNISRYYFDHCENVLKAKKLKLAQKLQFFFKSNILLIEWAYGDIKWVNFKLAS